MPTVYFAGGEDINFAKEGSGHANQTSTGRRRAAYSRVALEIQGQVTGRYVGTFYQNASGSLFAQARVFFFTSAGGIDNVIMLFRRSGTEYWRVNCSNDLVSLEVFDGGVWTTLDTASVALTVQVVMRFTVELVVHPSAGTFRCWEDGTLLAEATGVDTQGDAPDTTVDTIALAGANGSLNTDWSEMIVIDEEPTEDHGLVTLWPNAAGTTDEWAGAHTDVDEVTESTSDIIASDTADQVFLANTADPPLGIQADNIIVTARARRTGSGPQQAQLAYRSDGTNNFSATKALPTDFTGAAIAEVWDLSPQMSNADLAAIEIGIKSIT